MKLCMDTNSTSHRIKNVSVLTVSGLRYIYIYICKFLVSALRTNNTTTERDLYLSFSFIAVTNSPLLGRT
jgi:hypothetical protein